MSNSPVASVLWNRKAETGKVVCLEVDNEFTDFLCHVLQQPLYSVVAFLADETDFDQQTGTVAPYAQLYDSLCSMKPSMLRAQYPIHEDKLDLARILFWSDSDCTLMKSVLFPAGASETAPLKVRCQRGSARSGYFEKIEKRVKQPDGREGWIPLTVKGLVEDFSRHFCACSESLDGDQFPNFLSEYKPSLAHQGSDCHLSWAESYYDSTNTVSVADLVKRVAEVPLQRNRPFSEQSLTKESPIFKENLEFLITPQLKVVKSTMVNSFAIMKEAGVEPKDLRSTTVMLTRQAVAKLIRNMLSADCSDVFEGVFDVETLTRSGSTTPASSISSGDFVAVM